MSMDVTIRVCSHYQADHDMVFIEYFPKGCGGIPSWRRVSMNTVDARGWEKRVIRCSYCDRPTMLLDHHWPMMTGANRCGMHKDIPPSEWRD